MAAHHALNLAREMQAATPAKYYLEMDRPNEKQTYYRYHLRLRKKGTKGTTLASMSAQSLPGCCGVVVFYNFGGKKPMDVVDLIRIGAKAGQAAGYGTAMLTLRSESDILKSLQDWFLVEFRNGKTDSLVTVATRTLPQAPRPKVEYKNNNAGE